MNSKIETLLKELSKETHESLVGMSDREVARKVLGAVAMAALFKVRAEAMEDVAETIVRDIRAAERLRMDRASKGASVAEAVMKGA